jgi:hypothetical protein
MLRYIWVFLLAASAIAQNVTIPTGLVYQISTDRSKYIHGEDIVVTSILSNMSDRVQEVPVPEGSYILSETCLLLGTNRHNCAEKRLPTPDTFDDEYLMLRLKPGESYTNSFSLAGLTTEPYFTIATQGDEFGTRGLLPLGMWRITAIYHFESRTNDAYYTKVLRSNSLLVQVGTPDENESVEYQEFIDVLKVKKREERHDKLLNYISAHITGSYVRSAIRVARRTFYDDNDEQKLVLARQDKQTARSIAESDEAVLEQIDLLRSLRRMKEGLGLIDDAMVKRNIGLKKWRNHLLKEASKDAGTSK